jgi:pimeloyl-ACP methyl ester carboxylesterase
MVLVRYFRARAGFVGRGLLLASRAVLAALLTLTGSLALAVTPSLFPSAFSDGTPVDTAALGTRIPVLLVHGLGGGPTGWNNFLRAYEQNPAWRAAFKPYSFSYSSTAAEVNADPTAPRTMTALGAALRDRMQDYYDKPTAAPDYGFGNKRVIVLAHSMGGLVARSMMQEYVFRDGERGGQKVLHLITLGTPHQGTQLSDAAVVLGLQTVSDLSDTYVGFLNDTTWTNFDGLNMANGHCNPWLARLNNYAPSTGANYGPCGVIPANPLPGYYNKLIAYGSRELQTPDADLGRVGVYKPGSSTAYLIPYAYLHNGLARSYQNDGIVPMTSAQFDGPVLWRRGEAFQCDHRYIKDGYTELVRSPSATYSDIAFCAGTGSGVPYPSGTSGAYAISGSIYGVPGGIIDTIRTVSQVERAFNWTEAAFPAFLQPSGARSDITGEFYYRYYPSSGAYLGVTGGNLYYLGPASNNQLMLLAPLADILTYAQATGF